MEREIPCVRCVVGPLNEQKVRAFNESFVCLNVPFYQHLRHAKPLVCQRATEFIFICIEPAAGADGRACEAQKHKSHNAFAHFSMRFINLIVPRIPRPNELRLAVMYITMEFNADSAFPWNDACIRKRAKNQRENK